MKYSIIIPTMWFHMEQLCEMLQVYNSLDIVGEILLIDNNGEKRPELNFDKVRIFGNGENIYVNPAWKLGVQESKFDKVILANDDITIKGDINRMFELIGFLLNNNVVIGPSEKCYTGIETNNIKFTKLETNINNKMNYGFGVFMFMKKSTFLNTKIPNNLLVWCGDRILHLMNDVWCFEGVEIVTCMSGTSSKINLSGIASKDNMVFKKYLRSNGIK